MEQKIKQIIDDADIGELRSYTWLGNGFSSNAYQIDTSAGSYVLLETKKNAVEATNYKAYFANLKCLERSGFEYAPKAVYLSEDARSIVITKVRGTVISNLHKLESDERKALALKLANTLMELKSIKSEILAEEFAAIGLKLPQPFTQQQDWEKYVINTFYPHKESAPPDAHTDWLEQQITDHKLPKVGTKAGVFHHGDTSEPNILVTEDNAIYLIDWGSACFYASSKDTEDFGLSYVMNHVRIMQEYKDEILHYVADAQNLDYETLRALVYNKQKAIKIADIAWAYMMYTRATNNEVADKPEIFKEILDRRIKEYETEFQ